MVFPCGWFFQLGNRRGHEILQNLAGRLENCSSERTPKDGCEGDPELKTPISTADVLLQPGFAPVLCDLIRFWKPIEVGFWPSLGRSPEGRQA